MVHLLPAKNFQQGFTMLEMMVVMAIVLTLTAIVIMYIPQFRDRSGLDLVAQEVAITVRTAQVYASGGKIPLNQIEARPSYGVYFAKDSSDILLYTDEDVDQIFDEGENSDTYELHGIMVSKICADDDCGLADITTTYTRPNLTAKICTEGGDDCSISQAEIYLKTVKSEKEKVVRIFKNGQISVSNVETP